MKYESHWGNMNHIGESQKIKKRVTIHFSN